MNRPFPLRRLLPGLLAASALFAASSRPQVPAFPGAEGAGAMTPGGRGGRVIYVTNLQDRGPGSFRDAVEAAGPRIVVFAVSGHIELQSPVVINHPFLTVAGQTAPGDGICISGGTTTLNAGDVVIRYLHFRRDDALDTVHSPGRILIDRCSFSVGLDGNVPVYRSVPAPVDTDRDGMPDAWERRHGLDPHNPADGIADPDRDGYTNLEEYLNGTNPREFVDYTDPASNVNTL